MSGQPSATPADKRALKRGVILDAAEAVFRQRTFEKATMSEVAEVTGLAKGTLYRYFVSKDDLYLGLAARGIKKLEELMLQADDEGASPQDRVAASVGAYARFARDYPMYFAAFSFFHSASLDFEAPTESLQDCERGYERLLQFLMERVPCPPDEQGRLAVAILSMATTGFLTMLDRREGHLRARFGDQDFVALFSAFLGRGIGGAIPN